MYEDIRPSPLLARNSSVGVGGNLVSDAHLAALAIEHRCGIVSSDHDFSRVPGVELVRPR